MTQGGARGEDSCELLPLWAGLCGCATAKCGPSAQAAGNARAPSSRIRVPRSGEKTLDWSVSLSKSPQLDTGFHPPPVLY
jgi:hypothetical protein